MQLIAKIKLFITDHWHLLFKSSAYNHIRIQRCSQNKNGEIACRVSFSSYSELKRYQKKVRRITVSLSSAVAMTLIVAVVSPFIFNPSQSGAANYSWTQTAWDASATPGSSIQKDGAEITYESKEEVDTSSGTSMQLTSQATSIIQDDDGTSNTGFNLTGSSFSQTQVNNTSTDANVTLAAEIATIDSAQVSTGYNASMALKADGTVWAWGQNANGQMGDNTIVDGYMPVQVHGENNIGYLTDVVQVADGYNYSLALKADGTVWAWGYNSFGQLGDNTIIQRTTPVQVHGEGNVGYLTGVAQIAIGSVHSLALKTDGTVWAWGQNANGQLGDNTIVEKHTPVQVHGEGNVGYLTGVAQIASGSVHSLALKTDGTVWAWGSSGRLGDSTFTQRNTPVQVHGEGNVGYLTGVAQISGGSAHSFALKTDGSVWGWGYNSFGQLGDNTIIQRTTPVQTHGEGNVGYLTGVSQVFTANTHSLALKTDGTVWTWGHNIYGKLGDNTTTQRTTPVQVHGEGDVGYLTGVAQISGGSAHSFALKTDGSIWGWGYNGKGQLGDNTIVEKHTPVQTIVTGGGAYNVLGGVAYPSSGTFTSGPINTGQKNNAWGNLSWTSSTGQTITIKARSDADGDFSNATAWGSCSTITSGQALSTGGCVVVGDQYIQYQASLSTADTSTTPTLENVTLNFSYYPTTAQSLISSAFDTTDDFASIGNLTWAATADTTEGEIKFQLRSADTQANLASAQWCGPTTCNATIGVADFYTTKADNSAAINSIQNDHDNRWMQYAAFLTSTDGSATPILQDVTLDFSFNNPPAMAVTAASQQSDGRIQVDYTMQETEITPSSGIYEQDTAYPVIFYQMDALTLAQDVTDAGTEDIIITNANNAPIPSSGKILIGTELISYTSQTGGTTLSGITRSQEFYAGSNYRTEATTHATGTSVYFLATQTSGQINVTNTSAINGVGKTAYWDAANETGLVLDGSKFTNAKIVVAANDNDAYGNRVGVGVSSAIEIDYEYPTITSVTTTSENGRYGLGQTISITVNFSENITTTTQIDVTLETGDIDYVCTISSITNDNSGSCDYVIGANEISSDLTASSIAGTIADQFANETSSLSVPTGQNIADSKNIVIDTQAPVVSISAPAPDAHRNTEGVSFTLDEELQSGSLTFTRTSGTADASSPHIYTLSGAELTTLTEQNKNVTGLVDRTTYILSVAATDVAGNVADAVTVTGVIYDTTNPTVSITSLSNDDFINNITDNSDISYTTDEDLAGSGATYLTFTRTAGTVDGSSPRTCNLSGTQLLSGDHNNVDLDAVCGGFTLVDGTVYSVDFHAEDLAGNTDDATQKTSITYDITAPTLISFTSTANTCGAVCAQGDTVTIAANYDENIDTSTMTIRLVNTASPQTEVTLNNVSGSAITGVYTVQGPYLGHDTDDLNIAAIVSESVVDFAGNSKNNSALPNGNNLADNQNIVVDTGPPVIENFSVTTGSYKESNSVIITADYSEAVADGSAVSIKLNTADGAEDSVEITLDSVSSDKVSGTYIVQAGDNAEDLQVTSVVSQDVVDLVGNHQIYTAATIAEYDAYFYAIDSSIAAVTNITGVQIDTTVPVLGATPMDIDVISGITSSQTVDINLSATDNFDLSNGFVQFSLNGGTDWCTQIAYATTVSFDITSSSCGGNTNLEIKTVTARFIDAAGNISATTSDTVEFDSEEPVLNSFSTSATADIYGSGQTIDIIATYHETISDGSITVNLNNGATVVLDNIAGTTLTGTYTIGATASGEDASSLVVGSIAAESVSDTASPANVRSDSTVPGNNLTGITIDTTAPEGSIIFNRSVDSGQITIDATDTNDTDMQTEIVVTDTDTDACSFTDVWVTYADNINTDITENSNSARKACVKFKDLVGNESLIYSVITPETPSGVQVDDISNMEIPFYGSMLTWSIPIITGTSDESGDAFSRYEIAKCETVDSAGCTPAFDEAVSAITDKTQNYFADTGLTAENFYCYQVRFKDKHTDYSLSSSNTCFQAGHAPTATDSQVSIISGNPDDIKISDVTEEGATIFFQTTDSRYNRPVATKAQIEVYTSPSLSGDTLVATTDEEADFAVVHTTYLTGLESGTQYYLKIIAVDSSVEDNAGRIGILAYSSDGIPALTFSTLGTLTTVTLVSDDVTTGSKAVIEFNTDQNAKCIIDYKRPIDSSNEGTTTVETEFKKHHAITISNILFADTLYDYNITCFDTNDIFAYLNDQNFSTSDKIFSQGDVDSSGDATSPKISSVTVSEIKGESVIIKWNTNETANSLVAYEIDGSEYMKMAGDYSVNISSDTFSTSHLVTLNDLIPATKYNYYVISYDVAGNIAQSSQSSFTTKEPSSLSAVKVVSKALGQATVTWETGSDTTSILEYGLTTSYGEQKESQAKIKLHELTISSLTSGEIYHFRVKGEDADGNLYASTDNTFQPKSPPKISDFKVDEITEHGARVSFLTNVPTSMLVYYTDAEDGENSGVQGKQDFVTKHELVLNNMSPGIEFGLSLKVRDEDGNETEESFQSFRTAKDENAPKIEQVRTDSALAQNDKVQSIVSWKTDEAADTWVVYTEGRAGKEVLVKVSDVMTTAHVAVMTVFKPGVVYYFKVKSTDIAGNEAVSSEFALLTPKRKENIVQVIVNNFQDIFSWAQ